MIARAKVRKPSGVKITCDPERQDSHFHINLDYASTKWEQWLLLTSDHHWDNPKCRLDLLERDFKEAKDRNALIFGFGDIYCAMQGPHDKRRSKGDTRPEHDTPAYFDELVNHGADWYGPYRDNIALLTLGNHETAVLRNSGTNLIDRLASKLRDRGGIACAGAYCGWVNFRFDGLNDRASRILRWHHGAGGGGPVTKGMIDNNRTRSFVRGADIYCSGHVHELNLDVNESEEYQKGIGPVRKREYFVRLATYKDEFKPNGYHIEKGRGPRPLGGWWCRLYAKANRGGVGIELIPTETD